MSTSLLSNIKRLATTETAPDGEPYLSLSTKATLRLARTKNRKLKDVEFQALESGIIPERYHRNIGTIGIEGQMKLRQSQVAIVGVGGLGGSVLELLGRLGIGKIVSIDGDSFVDSNLNRQVLSQMKNLGKLKVKAARRRVKDINPAIETKVYSEMAKRENLPKLIQGSQAVVDGLDNIQTRFVVESACRKMQIPFVHGAVVGFAGQVMTVFPGDKGLESIYGARVFSGLGVETELGNPSMTPTLIATWQASEVVKILLEWGNTLRNKVLVIDLREQFMEIVDLI